MQSSFCSAGEAIAARLITILLRIGAVRRRLDRLETPNMSSCILTIRPIAALLISVPWRFFRRRWRCGMVGSGDVGTSPLFHSPLLTIPLAGARISCFSGWLPQQYLRSLSSLPSISDLQPYHCADTQETRNRSYVEYNGCWDDRHQFWMNYVNQRLWF